MHKSPITQKMMAVSMLSCLYDEPWGKGERGLKENLSQDNKIKTHLNIPGFVYV